MLLENLKIISDDEIKNYALLGSATGASFSECIYLGVKYKTNFMSRVKAVRIIERSKIAKQISISLEKITGKKQTYISVEFYEKTIKS